MNGSKNLLLATILLLALLPWGILFALLNTEKGNEILGTDGASVSEAAIRQEEATRFQGIISNLENEVAQLKQKLATGFDSEEAAAEVETLKQKLSTEKEEKLDAMAENARLRTEYNSALSEVVRLKTERMAAEAIPKPKPEPEPEPEEPKQPAKPANTGGWILPPGN